MQFQPRHYQENIINRIVTQPASFIIAKMGAGKTSSTLYAIKELFNQFMINHVLIIAPLNVASYTWPDEIRKWDNFKDIDYTLAIGTERHRYAAICKKAMVTIINRENVPWLVKMLKKDWFFDCVIVDESTSFKNYAAVRFKALKAIRDKITWMVLLTGTPAPNSYLDLWPQVYLLDKGERLEKTITAFRTRYFDQDYSGYGYEIKQGADAIIRDKIQDLCIVVDNYKGLPELNKFVHHANLGSYLRQYMFFKKEKLLPIKDNVIAATNAAALTIKLQQYANGNVYDEEKRSWHLHDFKLPILTELLESCEDEQVLIVYSFKHDRDKILKHFKSAIDIKQNGAIDAWRKRKKQYLVTHAASAGHGLNFQDICNRVIWYSPTYSLELDQQLNARVYRQGQQKPVFIHYIVAKNTIEENILEVLEGKADLQSILIEEIKRLSEEKH